MAEKANNTGETARLQVVREYIKDLSFEVPIAHENLPSSGEEQTLEVAIDPTMRIIKDDEYEVMLLCQIKVVSKNKKHVFVLEIKYAGVFQLINIPKEHHKGVCMVDCAHLLFPSVRFWVSNITTAGSFPPVRLPPSFDFRALHAQKTASSKPVSN